MQEMSFVRDIRVRFNTNLDRLRIGLDPNTAVGAVLAVHFGWTNSDDTDSQELIRTDIEAFEPTAPAQPR